MGWIGESNTVVTLLSPIQNTYRYVLTSRKCKVFKLYPKEREDRAGGGRSHAEEPSRVVWSQREREAAKHDVTSTLHTGPLCGEAQRAMTTEL